MKKFDNSTRLERTAEMIWILAMNQTNPKAVFLMLEYVGDVYADWLVRHLNGDKSAKKEGITAIAKAIENEIKAKVNNPPD